MTWWKWSKTAGTNASVDGTINWAEGQPPSSVNDSARAMMAALAKGRDDISGSIVTGGTSTAYTVASNQTFTALQAGLFVAFTPHTTNGATVTINVDTLGAKPLRSLPGSSGEIGAGVLVAGTPYLATYFTSNGGEWILHGFYGNAFNIPIAGSMDYFGTTAPNSNFVFPVGQAISRTTYSVLFAIIGTTYGGGDGSTTFNLPDLRGRVSVALDNMGGVTANRLSNAASGGLASVRHTLGGAGGEDAHTITIAEMASHGHGVNDSGHSHPMHTDASVLGATGANFIVPSVGNKFGQGKANDIGSSDSAVTGISIQNTGGGAAHNNCQPSFLVNKIMRII